MKASELRIGNLVAYEPTIDDWEEIIVKCGNIIQCEISPDSFTPIPLTEEWLLKFGFKKQLDKSFAKNDFSIFLDKRFKTNLFLQENQEDFKWFSYELKVEYIHQLQNLYFALTGEELNFKSE
jgi:hypothetical protein